MKTIIDTDPGHDDALALIFAIKSPDIDVVMISTVAGNTTAQKAARNAQNILDLVGSNVPIFYGSDEPLERDLETAQVHGESGIDGLDIEEKDINSGAVKEIIKRLEKYEEVKIVTLGPLTNLARVIEQRPDLKSSIEQVVIMGGAIRVSGNQNRVAEFNMYVDPEAASIVFDASIDKLMVPLDPCNDIKIFREEIEKISDAGIYEPVKNMMEPYMENLKKHLDTEGALVYDVLAVYAAFFEEYCQNEELDVKIETEGEFTRGMTVADLRDYSNKITNCQAVKSIDSVEFKEKFLSNLRSGD